MLPLRFQRATWMLVTLGCLSFTAFRLAQWAAFADPGLPTENLRGCMHAFLMGLRFDAKMLAHGVLLCFLPVSLLTVWARTCHAGAYLQRFSCALLLFAVNLAGLTQYYFYDFYKTPFSPILFGLGEDDTLGVLVSAWQSYPVARGLAGVLFVSAAQTWCVLKFSMQQRDSRKAVCRWGFCLATILALALMARGSSGPFPLNNQDATVSTSQCVNDLVRNAWQALHDAIKDRHAQTDIGSDVEAGIRRYGFDDLPALALATGARSAAAHDLIATMTTRTPLRPQLAAAPPHVVFALMESWGAHALDFDDRRNNLSGAMRQHLTQDYFFPQLLAAQNGTHPTLEALLFNSPLTPLTQGAHGQIALSSSAVLPFREQGYRTVFIYGGSNAWRNVGRVMQHQGFAETYDSSDIQARYPQAHGTIWGVYDEFLFRYASDLLESAERDGQPLFLFILSTTNHPPHSIPASYTPLALDTKALRDVLNVPDQQAREMLQTYQYATDQLGHFVDRIDRQPWRDRTIIAATGDHNLRTLLKYKMPEDMIRYHQVATWLRVPAPYRLPLPEASANRYINHIDLFPSLYHLALSDTPYTALGHSLFLSRRAEERYAFVDFTSLISDAGAVLSLDDPASATFGFDARTQRIGGTPGDPAMLQTQRRHAQARLALADWFIRYQIIGGKKREGMTG